MLKQNNFAQKTTISGCLRPISFGFLLFCLMASQVGCYLHSDEQEALAKDLQERYGMIHPAGTVALENLENDLNKLLESQKASVERVTSTSEVALVGMSWCSVISEADSIKGSLEIKAKELADKPQQAKDALKILDGQIKNLKEALKTANEAIEKLEKKKSLPQQLENANEIITTVTTAVGTVITNTDDPLNKRLKESLDEIVKYLNGLKNEETKNEKTFSLLLESVRLGRDVTALQIEALETEASYYKRLISIYTAEEQLFKQAGFEYREEVIDGKKIKILMPKERGQIENLKIEFAKYGTSCSSTNKPTDADGDEAEEESDLKAGEKRVDQTIQEITDKARSANENERLKAEDDLRKLLVALGKLQTLQVTNSSRINDLALRESVENYRRARLLDAVHERQRMVLISTGLDGVVRYSEGGWRSEDIGRVISVVGAVAQVVTAIRTN